MVSPINELPQHGRAESNTTYINKDNSDWDLKALNLYDLKEQLDNQYQLDNHCHHSGRDSDHDCAYFWIPGRIEFLGKHTDYCGGDSIVGAINRGILVRVDQDKNIKDDSTIDKESELVPNHNDNVIQFTVDMVKNNNKGIKEKHDSKDSGNDTNSKIVTRDSVSYTYNIGENAFFEDSESDSKYPPGHWSQYFYCTFKRIFWNFGTAISQNFKASTDTDTDKQPTANTSFKITFVSNLPRAAGMSSSSALVVTAFLVLRYCLNQNTSKSSNCFDQEFDFDKELKKVGFLSLSLTNLISQSDSSSSLDSDHELEVVSNFTPSLYAYLGCCENGKNFNNFCGNGKNITLPGFDHGGVGTFGGSEDHAGILGNQFNGSNSDNSQSSMEWFSFSTAAQYNSIKSNGMGTQCMGTMGCERKGRIGWSEICNLIIANGSQSKLDLVLIFACSGVIAEKSTVKMDQYNDAVHLSQQCSEAIVEMLKELKIGQELDFNLPDSSQSVPPLRVLIDYCLTQNNVDISTIEKYLSKTSSDLVSRFRAFWGEMEIIKEVVRRVQQVSPSKQDYQQCHNLNIDNSNSKLHHISSFQSLSSLSLPQLLELSMTNIEQNTQNCNIVIPQTKYLAEVCRSYEGYCGSSYFGAGFGGSVYAIVEKSKGESFKRKWEEEYREKLRLSNNNLNLKLNLNFDLEKYPISLDDIEFFIMEKPCRGARRIYF